jgi:hypothetical protein
MTGDYGVTGIAGSRSVFQVSGSEKECVVAGSFNYDGVEGNAGNREAGEAVIFQGRWLDSRGAALRSLLLLLARPLIFEALLAPVHLRVFESDIGEEQGSENND